MCEISPGFSGGKVVWQKFLKFESSDVRVHPCSCSGSSCTGVRFDGDRRGSAATEGFCDMEKCC